MKIFFLITLILIIINSFSQEAAKSASWISADNIELKEHNVIHLRNSFQLEKVPQQFIVRISADNQYRLFINGRLCL